MPFCICFGVKKGQYFIICPWNWLQKEVICICGNGATHPPLSGSGPSGPTHWSVKTTTNISINSLLAQTSAVNHKFKGTLSYIEYWTDSDSYSSRLHVLGSPPGPMTMQKPNNQIMSRKKKWKCADLSARKQVGKWNTSQLKLDPEDSQTKPSVPVSNTWTYPTKKLGRQ